MSAPASKAVEQNPSAPAPQQQPAAAGASSSSSSGQQQRQSSSAAARQQRALFKPFLHTMRGINAVSPSSTPNSAQASSATPGGSAVRIPTIINPDVTPNEREMGLTSRSGRQLSEMEVLQLKHEPEFKRLMPVVAAALKDVVAIHEPLRAFAPPDDRYSYYETNAPPGITLDAYVQRISEYTYISPATLLASLIIMDRLAGRHPTLLFTTLNIYKLFFVAVRIASKVVDLRTLNNKNFAPVGGISNRHLNDIEARMLIDLRFDLYISPGDFRQYVKRATDGIPQPIAISSQFQRAMTMMQASQREQQQAQAQAQQRNRAVAQSPPQQSPGGAGVFSQSVEGGMAVHGGGPGSPNVPDMSASGDQLPDANAAAEAERRLPPNKEALAGDKAVPDLNL